MAAQVLKTFLIKTKQFVISRSDRQTDREKVRLGLKIDVRFIIPVIWVR